MVRTNRRCGRLLAATAALLVLAGCGGEGEYLGSGNWVPKAEEAQPNIPNPQQPPPPPPPDDEDVTPQTPVRATGLSQPTAIAALPDGSALVGERTTGQVTKVFTQPGMPQQPLYVIPGIDGSGDGGLLAMATSPNYIENGLVYAYITTATDNRVITLNKAGQPKDLLVGIPKGATGNTASMTITADGAIVIATGDAGDPNAVHDMSSLAGKVLKIDIFGDPSDIGSATPVVTTGMNDPIGMCTDGMVIYVVEAGDGAPGQLQGNAIYAIGNQDNSFTSSKSALISYTGDNAGAAGCITNGVALVASGTDSQSLMTTILDMNGNPTGDPTRELTGEYGRLRAITMDPATGGVWVATYNTDGIGTPAADDDRVLLLPPPQGGGTGEGPGGGIS